MEYTDRIIERCKSLSENINNFFMEERYIAEVDQIEQVTPEFLRNRAVSIVISELEAMGIVTNYDSGELLTDPVELETMFYLRSRYDGAYHYRTLRALQVEMYTTYCCVVDNTELDEDLLIELGNFFFELFPTDTAREYLNNAHTAWATTDRFRAHINAVRDRFESNNDPNQSSVTPENIELVSAFLMHTRKREQQLDAYMQAVVAALPNVIDVAVVAGYIAKYDHEKLTPDNLDTFSWYHTHKPTAEPACHKAHHLTVDHHHEYWVYLQQKAKDEDIPVSKLRHIDNNVAFMIVGSMVLDDMNTTEIHKAIDKHFGELTMVLSPQVLATMHAMADITIKQE